MYDFIVISFSYRSPIIKILIADYVNLNSKICKYIPKVSVSDMAYY